ncbi:MAG: FHA domain-containing protein [Lachnospiraceae bacterium]|nr:FHA domain-containing protein [Lachnospiraceae bacterium]
METEYVRSLQTSFCRINLDKTPEENRFQYGILTRGGIGSLLPCTLRYIDEEAYLYYDITSKQNVRSRFERTVIRREWLREFVKAYEKLMNDLGRFLLDERNVIWDPENVYEDVEDMSFSFLYKPYEDHSESFRNLLEYFVEHIDYEDGELVDAVYKMYDRYEACPDEYMSKQLIRDIFNMGAVKAAENIKPIPVSEEEEEDTGAYRKKSFGDLFKYRRKRQEVNEYVNIEETDYETVQVAEADDYGESGFGKTIYIDPDSEKDYEYKIYSMDGKILWDLKGCDCTIGKKKDEADLILEDRSVSRIHARILHDGDDYYIEDLNSTNGTFKNGVRLSSFEKKKLKCDDEIKIGKIRLLFKE